MTDTTTAFETALTLVDAGDEDGLRSILSANPELVSIRVESTEPPYDGYFHGATLLHHVAGNPKRGDLPDNIVSITRLLLEAGAAVDDVCGGGPSQPDTAEDVLGLVASSGHAVKRGFSRDLIDLLVDYGADINAANGACIWTALFHVVECKNQRTVSGYLARKGCELDLAYASGVGDQEATREFLALNDEDFLRKAYSRYRPSGTFIENPSRTDILSEALLYASANGRDAIVNILVKAGANVSWMGPYGPARVTALHCASWAGWESTAELLVGLGASIRVRDHHHNSTPPGWAKHCNRDSVIAYFNTMAHEMELDDAIDYGDVDRLRTYLKDNHPDAPIAAGDPGCLLRSVAFVGNVEMVRLLLDSGANPNLHNRDGRSALDYAVEREHSDVQATLRSHNSGPG